MIDGGEKKLGQTIDFIIRAWNTPADGEPEEAYDPTIGVVSIAAEAKLCDGVNVPDASVTPSLTFLHTEVVDAGHGAKGWRFYAPPSSQTALIAAYNARAGKTLWIATDVKITYSGNDVPQTATLKFKLSMAVTQ